VADTDEHPLTCAECGREPREDENAADEWRAYRDSSDELPVFCPECAEREFGVERAS
jgi:DNA-directed RNA polymerase subunit RPC12/RpoP